MTGATEAPCAEAKYGGIGRNGKRVGVTGISPPLPVMTAGAAAQLAATGMIPAAGPGGKPSPALELPACGESVAKCVGLKSGAKLVNKAAEGDDWELTTATAESLFMLQLLSTDIPSTTQNASFHIIGKQSHVNSKQ